MKQTKKKFNWYQRFSRTMRYNYIKLLRSSEGVKKVSLGFAIGFGLEMIVLPTASLIYLLFYPIVKLSGGSLSTAIIGNVIGKLTFLPIILLPFSKKLGELIYPANYGNEVVHREHSFMEIFQGNFGVLKDIFHGGLHIIIGQSIFGAILGFASYFVIYYLYERSRKRRLSH